jgi:serine protease Do
VDERVEVTVLRSGKEQTFTAKVGELSERQAMAEGGEERERSWGLSVANLSAEIRRRFRLKSRQEVAVTAVEPGSPTDVTGIRPGDVIEAVNRQPVGSIEDFDEAETAAKEEETLLLLARRGSPTSPFALRKAE